MNGESKITASHLDRQAVVYVRQSSLAQVREHTESTTRQYALTETATRLGWPAARVAVIDADLGLSGRDAHSRSGLQDLVGRVCVGPVGRVQRGVRAPWSGRPLDTAPTTCRAGLTRRGRAPRRGW